MHARPKLLIFLLRVSLGWIFFYSGLMKILDRSWSAKGFLRTAKTFPELFQWFAQPQNILWVDMANKWGQVLIGTALILGVAVPIAAVAGVLLMVLYYFPGLRFPYVGQQGFLIDQHVIYALALLLLMRLRAGNYWGLGSLWSG